MKKALFILMLSLVGIFVGMVFRFAPEPAPKRGVETSFLEFTNTPSGPRARFAVTYGRRFRGWSWRDSTTSYQRADGAWEEWVGADNRKTYQFIDNRPPFPRTRDGKRINTVIALPVGNTNSAWRVVLKVDESKPWPLWPVMVADQLKSLMGKPSRPPGPGQSYLLTNQTSEVK